ncbi:MAG TPA: hypothetical protein VD928_01420, partial [Candidatus Paceibacterota bacterium]|nr:hypothetical protein [Candidatus Paceibacterota bacterium]
MQHHKTSNGKEARNKIPQEIFDQLRREFTGGVERTVGNSRVYFLNGDPKTPPAVAIVLSDLGPSVNEEVSRFVREHGTMDDHDHYAEELEELKRNLQELQKKGLDILVHDPRLPAFEVEGYSFLDRYQPLARLLSDFSVTRVTRNPLLNLD